MPLQRISLALRPTGRARSLADRTTVIRLFDAYAGLLTARQQLLVRLYYHDDLSLGEIAGRLRVSRQAVFDSLRRSLHEMRYVEARLRVLAAAGRNGRRISANKFPMCAVCWMRCASRYSSIPVSKLTM